MDLASACIDRQAIKCGRTHDGLVEWQSKCAESKCFCTTPDTNAINFDILWGDITYKTSVAANKCG